jgi:hypothetical protein
MIQQCTYKKKRRETTITVNTSIAASSTLSIGKKKINQPHIACPISPQLSQTNSSMYRTYDLSLQEKKSHANHHKHSNHLLHATAIHAVFSPIISVASQQRRAGSRHRSDKAVKSSHLGRRKGIDDNPVQTDRSTRISPGRGRTKTAKPERPVSGP